MVAERGDRAMNSQDVAPERKAEAVDKCRNVTSMQDWRQDVMDTITQCFETQVREMQMLTMRLTELKDLLQECIQQRTAGETVYVPIPQRQEQIAHVPGPATTDEIRKAIQVASQGRIQERVVGGWLLKLRSSLHRTRCRTARGSESLSHQFHGFVRKLEK